MEIKKTDKKNLACVMELYEDAKEFMKESGNPNQWIDGYPFDYLIAEEIEAGHHYSCWDEDRIVGVFSLILGDDPTYATIHDGAWLSDEPYGTVHRLCTVRGGRGIATKCMEWCFEKTGNLRADTHEDNIPMQKLLEKTGFQYCGLIRVENGSTRLAYQKVK